MISDEREDREEKREKGKEEEEESKERGEDGYHRRAYEVQNTLRYVSLIRGRNYNGAVRLIRSSPHAH